MKLASASIWSILFSYACLSLCAYGAGSKSIYQTHYKWETQTGATVELPQLRGQPVVAVMLFTQCQGACPIIMSELKAIESRLSPETRSQVRFAIFSFDSEDDTPANLLKFARKHQIDLTRWTFFHGSQAAVRELAALLNIRFKRTDDGSFDHSNAITVLDREGAIVHQQIGLRQPADETLNVLKKLAALPLAPKH